MNTTILSKWTKSGAGLGLAATVVAGMLASLPAHSATLGAKPVLVAGIDVTLVLEAPPPPRHEVIIERDRPSRDHVWVTGYYAWREGHHVWIAGHWELPPHGRTVWVEPRWEKHDRGYVFIEGYWAEPHHEHDRDHDHH